MVLVMAFGVGVDVGVGVGTVMEACGAAGQTKISLSVLKVRGGVDAWCWSKALQQWETCLVCARQVLICP